MAECSILLASLENRQRVHPAAIILKSRSWKKQHLPGTPEKLVTLLSFARAILCAQLTEEEKAQMAKRVQHDGEEKVIEALLGRRKYKKDFEYEVKWLNRRDKDNSWIPRERCAALSLLGVGVPAAA